MILNPENCFVSLSYSNVDFLIDKASVENAVSCKDDLIFADEKGRRKIKIDGDEFFCFDFDVYAESLGQNINPAETRNCIVLHLCEKIFGSNFVALVCGSDCRVKYIDYKQFSLFSDFYAEGLCKKGILGSLFSEDCKKINYLLDIESFLRCQILKSGK